MGRDELGWNGTDRGGTAGGTVLGTVLASFLQSFVFATSLFTAPARPLLTRAAAAERLAGALRGTAPHRSVEDTVGFATSMLSGVTWRSGGPR